MLFQIINFSSSSVNRSVSFLYDLMTLEERRVFLITFDVLIQIFKLINQIILNLFFLLQAIFSRNKF